MSGHAVPAAVITCDADGLAVHAGVHRGAITRRDIAAIHAYKVDLMSVDCITLDLVHRNGSMLTVNEHMTGYSGMLESMQRQLPGFTVASWYSAVAYPAFATNLHLIWSRSDH